MNIMAIMNLAISLGLSVCYACCTYLYTAPSHPRVTPGVSDVTPVSVRPLPVPHLMVDGEVGDVQYGETIITVDAL